MDLSKCKNVNANMATVVYIVIELLTLILDIIFSKFSKPYTTSNQGVRLEVKLGRTLTVGTDSLLIAKLRYFCFNR